MKKVLLVAMAGWLIISCATVYIKKDVDENLAYQEFKKGVIEELDRTLASEPDRDSDIISIGNIIGEAGKYGEPRYDWVRENNRNYCSEDMQKTLSSYRGKVEVYNDTIFNLQRQYAMEREQESDRLYRERLALLAKRIPGNSDWEMFQTMYSPALILNDLMRLTNYQAMAKLVLIEREMGEFINGRNLVFSEEQREWHTAIYVWMMEFMLIAKFDESGRGVADLARTRLNDFMRVSLSSN